MNSNDLAQLHEIARARHDAAQAVLVSVLAEEQRLRGLLEGLTKAERDGRDIAKADFAFETTQADRAWSQWVGKNRSTLNLKLAQLLVRKDAALKAAQLAFGKESVLDNMASDLKRHDRKRREVALLDATMQASLFR